MTRTSFRPVAALGLAAAVLIYVGCTKPKDASGPSTFEPPKTPVSAVKTLADDKQPKVIAEWSAQPPAGLLVISGEQHGYLQPCGCTDGQLGGLGRRFDLIEKLRGLGWPVVPIDLGSLIDKPATSRGGFEQEKIKFDTALKALASMKYEAVALGAEDLRLGVFQTLGVLMNLKEPRFLAANVKPGEGLEGTVRPTLITQVGPVKVGITAVMDPTSFASLPDPDKASLLTIKPPDEVLGAILGQLQKESEIRVLLVQGPPEEAKRLAEKFPGFEIVVGTSVYPDPDDRPEMLNQGRTMLINVGQKGKYVGVVGIFPGKTPMIQYRKQPLDQRGLTEAESIRVLIDQDMQKDLRALGVVENFPRRPNGAGSPGAKYVGAETCQACHPKTFEKWSSTKHAKAYVALENPRRNREFDAECISCHTTGFKFDSGWVSAEKTPNLKGNQCENCHGPASLHIAEPDNLIYRKPLALTKESADKSGLCINCHDEDNDHNFTFDARYAEIFHKGFDSYEDPKVHQAQPPKVAAGKR